MLTLQPYGVIEPGVSFIPNTERHQIDPRLVTEQMSEFRQLMSENSSSYVQDADTGSSQPQTLGEAKIKLQAANRIVASMLSGAYRQETFLYEEQLRRFFLPVSGDPEVIRFQEDCKRDGIPTEYMEVECWNVEITKAFGSGDQTLAESEVSQLLQLSPQLDPSARRSIQRSFIAVTTKNSDLANELVPPQANKVDSGRKAAEDCFGTLMSGAQVGLREGVEQESYVASMLASIDAVVAQIKSVDDMGTPQQVIGLNLAIQDVEQHLQLMEQDPNQKAFITAASKELGKIGNEVKAFQQRQEEKAKAGEQDPKAESEIHLAQVKGAQELHLTQEKHLQATSQKQQQFEQKLNQDQQAFSLKLQQQMSELEAYRQKTMTEIEALRSKTLTDIQGQEMKTQADIKAQEEKTNADVKAKKKMAAATPAATAQ